MADRGVEGLRHLFDGDLEVWRAYGVTGQPAWAFIDDSGEYRVVLGRLGE